MEGSGVKTLHQPIRAALVIPTCDRPEGLLIAVKSGLAALPSNAELIVVDDGVKHAAEETLSELVGPRLRVEKTKGKQGPSAARNLGVSKTSADIVFFLDDDDALVADYASRILDLLKSQEPSPEFGFSAMQRNGKISRKSIPTGLMNAKQELGERLGGLGMGFWIKVSLFQEIGGLDEDIWVNEDTEFCLRLAEREAVGWYEAKPGVVIDAGVSQEALHEKPSITKTADLEKRARVFELFLSRYDDLLTKHPQERKKFATRVIRYEALSVGIASARKKASVLLPRENTLGLFIRILAWRATALFK